MNSPIQRWTEGKRAAFDMIAVTVFKADGSSYRTDEVALIRKLTAR